MLRSNFVLKYDTAGIGRTAEVLRNRELIRLLNVCARTRGRS